MSQAIQIVSKWLHSKSSLLPNSCFTFLNSEASCVYNISSYDAPIVVAVNYFSLEPHYDFLFIYEGNFRIIQIGGLQVMLKFDKWMLDWSSESVKGDADCLLLPTGDSSSPAVDQWNGYLPSGTQHEYHSYNLQLHLRTDRSEQTHGFNLTVYRGASLTPSTTPGPGGPQTCTEFCLIAPCTKEKKITCIIATYRTNCCSRHFFYTRALSFACSLTVKFKRRGRFISPLTFWLLIIWTSAGNQLLHPSCTQQFPIIAYIYHETARTSASTWWGLNNIFWEIEIYCHQELKCMDGFKVTFVQLLREMSSIKSTT